METGDVVNSEIKENTVENAVEDSFIKLRGTLEKIERKNDLLFMRGSHWDEVRKKNPQILISPLNKQGVELSLNPTFDTLEISWMEDENKRINIRMGIMDAPGEKGPYYAIRTQTRDKNYETLIDSYGSEFRHGKIGVTGRLPDGSFRHTSEPKELTDEEWNLSEDKALLDKVTESLKAYASTLP